MNQRNKFNIKSALKDKAHRFIPLFLIPILILSFFPMSVSAASGITAYSYRELFTSAYTSGGYDYFNLSAPVSSYEAITEFNTPAEVCVTNSGSNSITDTFYSGRNKKVTFVNFKNNELLRVDDIPNGSNLKFDIKYSAVAIGQETKYSHPIAQVGVTYLDENYKSIKTQQYKFERNYDPIPGVLQCELELEIPEKAKYLRTYVIFSHIKTESADITSIKWEILDWNLALGIYRHPEVDESLNGHSWLDLDPQIVGSFPGSDENLAHADFKFSAPVYSMQYDLQYSNSDIWNCSSGMDSTGLFAFSYGSTLDCYVHFFRNKNHYLNLNNISEGSRLLFSVIPRFYVNAAFTTPRGTLKITYLDKNGYYLDSDEVSDIRPNVNYEYEAELIIYPPDGAEYCFFTFSFKGITQINDVGVTRDNIIFLKECNFYLRTDPLFVDVIQNQTQVNQNNTIINGTPEQNQQVSDANDKMESAGDKLGDLNDQMQVEKPDTDDMDVSIDSLVPGTSILAYTQPILEFWENPTLKAMLIIVMTLVLVSWVMFGKKG